MQLKRLKAFHAVARLKSFSEAVTLTGLSQPTLSRLIKQLEDDINVELFDRYHRPLQLTQAGAFFFEKTDNILKELDSAITLTQRVANPPASLNIGFVPSVLYGLLPLIVARLKQRLPELDVHLKDVSSFKQIDALGNGTIDVAIGRFAHDNVNIKQFLMRRERYVAALPSVHPLASATHIHLSQLQHDRVILYHQAHLPANASAAQSANTIKTQSLNTESALPNDQKSDPIPLSIEPLLHLFGKQNAAPHNTTNVSDIQIALGLVAAGEGVTLVPDSLKTVRTEQISYIPLVHEDATTPIYISTLHQPIHPAYTQLLDVVYEIYEARGITYTRSKPFNKTNI